MKKALLIYVILTAVIIISAFPLVSAVEITIQSNTYTDTNGFTLGYLNDAVGVSVWTNETGGRYLTEATFYLEKTGLPTGTIRAVLYDYEGGSDAVLEAQTEYGHTSDMDISTLTGSVVAYNFTFDGTDLLSEDHVYMVCLTFGDGEQFHDSSNYVWVQGDFAVGGHASWQMERLDGTADWQTASGHYDVKHVIYGETAGASPTTGPLPTSGSYDTSDIDEVINTLAGYMVPLTLFLLPAILLGYMTKWAMWPIIIGLAIGAGLTYLFLGAQYVWLVFLVACGIGGAIYKGRGTN